MPSDSKNSPLDASQAIADLARLRAFNGLPKDFWPALLAALQQLTLSDQLVLLVRKPDAPWRRMLDFPAESEPSRMLTEFFKQSPDLATRASAAGGLVTPLNEKESGTAGHFVIVGSFPLQPQEECAIAALLSEVNAAQAREALLRLRLALATPEFFIANTGARQAAVDVEKLALVLDLTAGMNAEKHYLGAVFALCNGLATRYRCDRVSLGWLDGAFIKMQAISRTEKFDRQMAAVRSLEAAMEECLDQDDEIVWPKPADATVITRSHEQFATEQKTGNICSIPLRTDGEPVAVVTFERAETPFTLAELQQMRLVCDMVSPRLADLHQQDRWFGSRWALQLRQFWAKVAGPEYTWAKAVAAGITLLLAILFFVRVPYRVQGTFVLRSDEMAYLAAPFDGYIEEVLVRPGDALAKGAPLMKFKTAEQELEESFALADVNRYQREAEKARAAADLADMRISEAMVQQSQARLDMARYRIEQATIRAPFTGVVVEGDLRERLGAPVKTADVMFRLARLDALYVEAEINERDVHDILKKTDGEIAFISRPREKFPVHIIAVEPAAVQKDEANVFLVRCALDKETQAWWRPGMSGLCKIKVENRTLFWIITHRTMDFLRLKLWW